mmetsp:Transcript_148076/g.457768  ORF Transcript_148076/g.457768 Transcript_148076/m.457768 type:complete len:84 (-) Transcript_148076:31-282(-)
MLSVHLEDLKRCREKELLSEAEYQEQRRSLLKSFSSVPRAGLKPFEDARGGESGADAEAALHGLRRPLLSRRASRSEQSFVSE